MGFLHKLWNETLAGPMPDSGLGELRKYDSFSARSSPPADAAAANSSNEEMNITRSITIVRTNSSKYLRNIFVDPCSAPESPGQHSYDTSDTFVSSQTCMNINIQPQKELFHSHGGFLRKKQLRLVDEFWDRDTTRGFQEEKIIN